MDLRSEVHAAHRLDQYIKGGRLPALGEAEFDTNVTTNLAGTFIKLLSRAADGKSVAYHLSGKVSLSEGFLRTIPFDQRGSFNLQQ